MYKLDKKRIAIPPTFREAKYPWKTMKVGDSFFVPLKSRHAQTRGTKAGTEAYREANRVRVAVYAANGRVIDGVERRFVSRSMDGGIRVWRVA